MHNQRENNKSNHNNFVGKIVFREQESFTADEEHFLMGLVEDEDQKNYHMTGFTFKPTEVDGRKSIEPIDETLKAFPAWKKPRPHNVLPRAELRKRFNYIERQYNILKFMLQHDITEERFNSTLQKWGYYMGDDEQPEEVAAEDEEAQ